MVTKLKLLKKINTLENEIDTLNDLLRAQIVNKVMYNFNKIDKYDDLLEENKRLKIKLKKMKELSEKGK